MNVLEEKASWVSGHIKPNKRGIYMTYHETGGILAWHYDVLSDAWGDGLHVPNTGFRWLNVRIDLSK